MRKNKDQKTPNTDTFYALFRVILCEKKVGKNERIFSSQSNMPYRLPYTLQNTEADIQRGSPV